MRNATAHAMIHSRQSHSLPSAKEQEYLAGWQRSRAELDNIRKRLAAEQLRRDQQAKTALIAGLLPLIDNFEAVVAHQPAALADNDWAQGVLHVARQLQQVLADYRVEAIAKAGVPFDPAIHQAIAQEAAEAAASGTVLAVIQPGYRIDDTVIRPAKVKVAA